jgi:hypothetical protein
LCWELADSNSVTLEQNGSLSNLAPPKAPQKHHYDTHTQNLPIANSDGFSSLSIESLSLFLSLPLYTTRAPWK